MDKKLIESELNSLKQELESLSRALTNAMRVASRLNALLAQGATEREVIVPDLGPLHKIVITRTDEILDQMRTLRTKLSKA